MMKSLVDLITLSIAASFFSTALSLSIHERQIDIARTDPNDDPFYAQPTNIAAYAPGDVIDSRKVKTHLLLGITNSVQVKYRTTDGQGNAVSTVGTLWKPLWPQTNPPRILSYQYAEDSLNIACAPSWAWIQGGKSTNGATGVLEGHAVVVPALTKGYYVMQPDAEGPASTWLVGKMEGQAVLDGIRAAINFYKLDKLTTMAGLYGYSGGGHSTVWAASLAETYAPELRIRGAAYGGTPVDLVAAYKMLNGKTDALLAGGAVLGIARGWPELEDDFQNGPNGLTEEGKQMVKKLRARGYCLVPNLPNWQNVNFDRYFKTPLLSNPVFINVTNRESLLTNVSSINNVPVPKFPRYSYHGNADVTVPYAEEAAYVKQQCERGANLQFRTFDKLDHIATAIRGIPAALKFIDLAFDGRVPNCKCGENCM